MKLTIPFFLQANNYATVTFDAQGNIIQEVVFTPFIFKTIKITKNIEITKKNKDTYIIK